MRLEGEWVIAESGQDRKLFGLIQDGDEFQNANEPRFQEWTPMYSRGPYGNSDVRGLLNRRRASQCSPEIMALLVPQPNTEMQHFI